MKCQDFEQHLRQFAGGGTQAGDNTLLEHAQNCPNCSQRLAEEQRLQQLLLRLSGSFRELKPSSRIQEEIREAYRSRIQAAQRQAAAPQRKASPRWLVAAAAIVLAVAAGWLYRTTNIPWSPDARNEQGSVSDPSLNRTPEIQLPAERMYSEFIPIGNCRSVDCLDRAHMMRIDLPRSSVSYFGIPKTKIRSRGDRIAADVLVGEDGIARAIRFVY
jgi:hypothetical protein